MGFKVAQVIQVAKVKKGAEEKKESAEATEKTAGAALGAIGSQVFIFTFLLYNFRIFLIKQIFKIGSGRVSFALHARGALNSLK